MTDTLSPSAVRLANLANEWEVSPAEMLGMLLDSSRIPLGKPTYSLTLPVPPSVNNYYKRGSHGVYLAKSVITYRLKVMQVCMEEFVTPIGGVVECNIRVYRPAIRGDADNYMKGLFDALNGRAWTDDKQVKSFTVTLFVDKKKPRLEIDIWEV